MRSAAITALLVFSALNHPGHAAAIPPSTQANRPAIGGTYPTPVPTATAGNIPAVAPARAGSSTRLGTGLEVVDPANLTLRFEPPTLDAARLGLGERVVRARTFRRLRAAGIEPHPYQPGSEADHLHVNVSIGGDGLSVQLSYVRVVTYLFGNASRYCRAVTWTSSITDGHGHGSDHALQLLDLLLSRFIAAWQAANHRP